MTKKTGPTPTAPQNAIHPDTQRQIDQALRTKNDAEAILVFMNGLGMTLSDAAQMLEIVGGMLQKKIKALMDREPLMENKDNG